MGRKKHRGGRRGGHFDGVRRSDTATNNRYNSYASIDKANAQLQMYYDSLLGLPEVERQDFWAALKRELPNSFRFCGSKGHALEVMKLMQTRYFPQISQITQADGQTVEPPRPVEWYPDSLAWWMTTPKNVIRKFPPFAQFQKFLVSETTVGNISRQEVVSMIPPLLLDVRPGMVVLDMCAAPGSKAAQLLEMIHVGEEGRIGKFLRKFAGQEDVEDAAGEDADLSADEGDDGRATGILVANDSDYKRSHMLIHQLKRLSSPNMVVTNHDATLYPSLRLPADDPAKSNYLRFDRILADVPCSGDGTFRKNVNLWKDWNPGNALGLHLVQTRILVRALQMLKAGGKVVYSTCSMNPVENEAVVASAIERCGGPDAVEIIDCSDQLPKLQRVPGLRQWQIMDKAQRIWSSWAEVEEFTSQKEDGLVPGRLSRTMFPRTDAADVVAELPLERCMRVYPHLQDTGGFFIAVLQKKGEFRAKPEEQGPNSEANAKNAGRRPSPNGQNGQTSNARTGTGGPDDQGVKRHREEGDDADKDAAQKKVKTEAVDDEAKVKPEPETAETEATPADAAPTGKSGNSSNAGPPVFKRKINGPYEEPFKYLPADHAVIELVKKFYNLSPRFPLDRFMVRNALGEPAKAIYYTSSLVRDLLVANEGRGVRFVHGGVKMFMKQEAPSAEICGWRIQSEGIPLVHGYVGPERIIYLRKKETLRKLLVEMFPKLSDGGYKDLGEVGLRANDMSLGCCVLRVEPDHGEDGLERMALPLWRSFHSVNLMLPKEDRSAMLLRIFNETAVLLNTGLQKNAAAAAAAKNEEGDEGLATGGDPTKGEVSEDDEDGGVKLSAPGAVEPAGPSLVDAMDVDRTADVAENLPSETRE